MVKISGIHVKFWKFCWHNKVYMYVVLPFAILSAPHKFTKLLKPILSFIRKQGIIVFTYIDDGFTSAPTYQACYDNIIYIMKTFTYFGFLINPTKSAPVPSTQVRSLEFHINSITMNVTLPRDKIDQAMSLCNLTLELVSFDIHLLAQLIGMLISLFPACPLGRLHYRSLECLKVPSLHFAKGSFDGPCTLDDTSVKDIQWWMDNIPSTACPIQRCNPTDTVYCDSSDYAWCGFFEGSYAHTFFTSDHCI